MSFLSVSCLIITLDLDISGQFGFCFVYLSAYYLDKVTLCSCVWPITYSVDQCDLKLTDTGLLLPPEG